MKFLVLTSLAFVVGQLWIAVRSLFRCGGEIENWPRRILAPLLRERTGEHPLQTVFIRRDGRQGERVEPGFLAEFIQQPVSFTRQQDDGCVCAIGEHGAANALPPIHAHANVVTFNCQQPHDVIGAPARLGVAKQIRRCFLGQGGIRTAEFLQRRDGADETRAVGCFHFGIEALKEGNVDRQRVGAGESGFTFPVRAG